jgi:ATP-dependent RNA helicase DeaD
VDSDRVEGGLWFRLPVGRSANADPKWLIPLICRLGHVTKKDIGQIRIFDRETKFEIAPEAEPRFSAALKTQTDDKMRIEAAGAPTGKGAPPRGGPPRGRQERHDAPRDDAPRRGPPPHRAKGAPGGKPKPPHKPGGRKDNARR